LTGFEQSRAGGNEETPMAGTTRSRTSSWSAPVPAANRNYPYNCWWVAGFSDEIGRDLLGRWLLDIPVLLYRTEDGRAVAIENRCPHRSAPLSLGCLKGDNVQCGYHGFTFSPDGECVHVPSTGRALPAAKIRTFPVIEQSPFVWVYLGDPARIEAVPAPHRLEWASEESFSFVTGRMEIAANYMLLKENVLNLTHFGYVHAKSFKITDWVDPPRLAIEGDRVGYHQSFVRSPLPPIFAEALSLAPGTPFNRENYGWFVSPALQIAAVDFIAPDDGTVGGRFRVAHATTPIDSVTMQYFYVIGRDHANSPSQMQALLRVSEIGFAEDEAMIEAVQDTMLRDRRGSALHEVSVKADAPGIQARRLLQRWMDKETG
jgi:phenylpropionate dioxygenase-like ring-hydroxylating dioxygenase large terminal subunit